MKKALSIINPDVIDFFTLISDAEKLNSTSINNGIQNIFQPGLVKEIIIAKILGHNVITNKRQPDACDKINPYLMYEYLTCFDGGEGQIDRMFKEPDDKRAKSLLRITINNKIYLAVFFLSSLKVKIIFEIEPSILVAETERQLDRSSNAISHVGFSENWAKENSKVVYTA